MKTLVRLLGATAFVSACASSALAVDQADLGQTRADLSGLIGHNVESARDTKIIGKVDAILATRDGRISTVIVHNRDRDVAFSWNQLRFTDYGKKVSVAFTRDEVNALPDYKYREVVSDSSILTKAPVLPGKKTEAASRTPMSTAQAHSNAKTAAAAPARAALPPGSMKTAAAAPANPADGRAADTATGMIVGHGVENAAGQRIGEIDNVVVDSHGKVSSVIVGVGGFLGVGKRDVALNWYSLKISDNPEKVAVNMTDDQLRALPQVQLKTQTTPTGKRMVVGSIGS